jgi:myo-inositol-1(or 4)-monophosphatase
MADKLIAQCADLATRMAAVAAEIARGRFGRATAALKADGSDVTDADTAIQDMMVERIAAAYPDHAIVGEEPGGRGGSAAVARDAEYCWVIDPLDGTRNFARGVPVFATSVALLAGGRPVMGLVRCLTGADVYLAIRGAGATLNGRKLAVDPRPCDLRSMVAVQSTIRAGDSRMLTTLSGVAVLRNLGSTALHLALVASGGFCGAVASECKLWDVAAGCLLVEEAGGLCTDWSGRSFLPFGLEAYVGRDVPFVAGGPATHPQLLARLSGWHG